MRSFAFMCEIFRSDLPPPGSGTVAGACAADDLLAPPLNLRDRQMCVCVCTPNNHPTIYTKEAYHNHDLPFFCSISLFPHYELMSPAWSRRLRRILLRRVLP